MSLSRQETNVHAEHLSNSNSAHETQVKSKVNAESDGAIVVPTINYGEQRHLFAKELKELISFKALMEADRHQFKQSGEYAMCRCPFHPDHNPSFAIYSDDDYARCYGCNWHGDIFNYEMDFHKVGFGQALGRLNDLYYDCPRSGKKAKAAAKIVKDEQPQLSAKQITERNQYAQRLATDNWLAAEVCRKRFERTGEPWNPAVIQHLAKNGFLGWAGDALAFIYPSGTKYRLWPERTFFWECDGSSLWRGELLAEAEHVYLTESETDGIVMLHTNIEVEEKNAAIIAVSGACNFQAGWAKQFRNKVVTLCFDSDKAGSIGANKTGSILKPYVSELLTYELGGVI